MQINRKQKVAYIKKNKTQCVCAYAYDACVSTCVNVNVCLPQGVCVGQSMAAGVGQSQVLAFPSTLLMEGFVFVTIVHDR